jgi:hypothetical protein
MQALQVIAAIAAVALVAAPAVSPAWTWVLQWLHAPADDAGLKPIGPNYQTAMGDLASVRLRLVRTGTLTKDAAGAIETLTLALMAGSDK